MKKTHILTLLLMLTVSVAFGQTWNYQLNYRNMKYGNTTDGILQFNGLSTFVNGISVPLRSLSDSSDNAASTKFVKQLVQGLGSPLIFSNGLTKTGDNVVLGGSLNTATILNTNENPFLVSGFTENSGFLAVTSSGANIGVLEGTSSVKKGINLSSGLNDGILVSDSENIGFLYNNKFYSENPRWIPDKYYVDSVASGGIGNLQSVLEAGNIANLPIVLADYVDPEDPNDYQGISMSASTGYANISNKYAGRVTNNLYMHPFNGTMLKYLADGNAGTQLNLLQDYAEIRNANEFGSGGDLRRLKVAKPLQDNDAVTKSYADSVNALSNETLQTVTSRGATTNQPIIVNNTLNTTGSLRVGATTGNNLLIDPNPGGNVKIRAFNNGGNQALEYVGGEHIFDGQLTLLSNITVPSYRANDFVINHENSAQKISLQSAGTNKLEVLSTGIRVNNLSGSSIRMVGVDATGLLTAQGLVSSYANANGSNATGTWPISVTGNSATTTKWGGVEADFTQFGVNLFGFLAYNEFGMGRSYSVSQVKSALGIGNPPFETSGTSAILVSSGRYIPQNTALTIYTLPTTANVGDVIFINGKGAGGWRISQNTGQVIHGATDTTVGSAGFVASTARYNSIAIVCVTANTEWIIQSSQGSLTIN